jgi:hypothetical protein
LTDHGNSPPVRWSSPAMTNWDSCRRMARSNRIGSTPGALWWQRLDQMVTGVTTAMTFCGSARRRSTGLRYRPPHDERKGSKGAQAHHDACRMVDEVGDDRSWAIDQEIRQSLLQGNGEMCSITSPPAWLLAPGWRRRPGAPLGTNAGAWGGPNQRREDLAGARVLARVS